MFQTKSPAVDRIADRTDCQWPGRSSEIDDFHFIWTGDGRSDK